MGKALNQKKLFRNFILMDFTINKTVDNLIERFSTGLLLLWQNFTGNKWGIS